MVQALRGNAGPVFCQSGTGLGAPGVDCLNRREWSDGSPLPAAVFEKIRRNVVLKGFETVTLAAGATSTNPNTVLIAATGARAWSRLHCARPPLASRPLVTTHRAVPS